MTACPYTYPTGPGFVSVYRVGAHGTKLTDSAVNQMDWHPDQRLGVTVHDDRLILTPDGDDLAVRCDADNARSIGLPKRVIEPLAVDQGDDIRCYERDGTLVVVAKHSDPFEPESSA